MAHPAGMTDRATHRPADFRKPSYWSDAPIPAPRAPAEEALEDGPTRYGDWVKNGIAIDF